MLDVDGVGGVGGGSEGRRLAKERGEGGGRSRGREARKVWIIAIVDSTGGLVELWRIVRGGDSIRVQGR